MMRPPIWALAAIWFCSCLPAGAQTTWPNKPAGFQTVLDCQFNAVGNPICGNVGNSYNAGSIVSANNAPESPPNVYRYFRGASDLVGGTQLDFYYAQATEVYVGLVIRTSPIFRGLDSGTNKIVLPGSNISNSVIGLYGAKGPNGGSGSFQLYWNDQNGGTVNNCHLAQSFLAGGTVANGPTVFGDCPGGLNYFPNAGSGAFSLGQWHYIEWCGKASQNFTSRDGIYKWFLDGTMIGNYSNVNTGAYWNAIYITPTWDGQGTPWGADAWWDIDRWVVARLVPGSCSAMSGGGVIIPTIDNPPGAPGAVTGFTATVGGVQ